jgi:hypothetical protein
MGAVAAGVSIISGVSGLIGKSKQASAERKQLQQQQYQQAVASASNAAIIASQQRLAQQEYQTGVLAKLAAYQQASVGLAAQDAQAQLQTQQQRFQIETQALTNAGQLAQQQSNLERQRVGIEIDTDQKLGGIAQRQTALADQLTGISAQEAAKLTEAQRRQISAQAAGRLASTSSNVKRDKDTLSALADSFSSALGVDRTETLSALQGMNEQTLALIGEQIGLSDNEASMETVTNNLKLAVLGAQNALDTTRSNLDLTRSGVEAAKLGLDYQQGVQDYADTRAYEQQQYGLGIQRDTVEKTGQSVQQSYSNAISSARGPGFFDYLNFGLNTYGAVSPLLTRTPTPQQIQPRLTPNYSGFPSVYSNYG